MVSHVWQQCENMSRYASFSGLKFQSTKDTCPQETKCFINLIHFLICTRHPCSRSCWFDVCILERRNSLVYKLHQVMTPNMDTTTQGHHRTTATCRNLSFFEPHGTRGQDLPELLEPHGTKRHNLPEHLPAHVPRAHMSI